MDLLLWALAPVTLPNGDIVGAVHEYVVPVGIKVSVFGIPFAGVALNDEPLQIIGFWFGISGVGFNVTVVVETDGGQLYASVTERVYIPPALGEMLEITGFAS